MSTPDPPPGADEKHREQEEQDAAANIPTSRELTVDQMRDAQQPPRSTKDQLAQRPMRPGGSNGAVVQHPCARPRTGVWGTTTATYLALVWIALITVPAIWTGVRHALHPHSILRRRSSFQLPSRLEQDNILCSPSHLHPELSTPDELYVYNGEPQPEPKWWTKYVQWLYVLPTAWGSSSSLSADPLLRQVLLPPAEQVTGPRIYTVSPDIAQVQRDRYVHLGPKRVHLGLLRGAGPVDCVALSNGTIQATLTNDQARKQHKELGTPVHVLPPGSGAYPGFHDAHVHLLDYGWSVTAASLNGCTSTRCIVERLEHHVRSSDSEWIEGLGWDQTLWSPAVFPTWHDLVSPLLKDKLIVLRRVDVHAVWVSKAVLDLLESQGTLPPPGEDIPGGLVVRDEHGQPAGVFVDNAMELVYAAMPQWTDEQRSSYLHASAERLLAQGITSVGDAATTIDTVDFLLRQDQAHTLPLRVYGMLSCPLPGTDAQLSGSNLSCSAISPLRSEQGGRLAVRSVKLFGDGALGSWGAAMWEPYEDYPDPSAPEASGMLLLPESQILQTIDHWTQRGFQVNTHCIGDKCNSLVLDTLAHLSPHQGGHRHRIEHAQLLRATDLSRFGSLGVIASMQPLHYASDKAYVVSRIGDRAKVGAYAWQPILRAGGTLAFGSDVPVEPPNVLSGFAAAVTRPTEEKDKWHAPFTLRRDQALVAFTRDAAFAEFAESWRGTLVPGAVADLAIVDRDLLDQRTTTEQIASAKVVATVLDGQVVYQAA